MATDKTARTRDLFLFSISAIYMFAFGSIYTQVQGLFGRGGIMPVYSLMKSIVKEQHGDANTTTSEEMFMETPTLLWFFPFDHAISLEFIAILGTILSFLSLVIQRLRIGPTYFLLWLFYMSIYKVGETFMWFQWDILLLEVGFISIVAAPLLNTRSFRNTNLHRQIPFWLVRWLLFRLMFASGIVKLTSKCPTWWGLTALNYHYESQCIPTPLAWWAHQLPDKFQQFSVLGTYFIEILLPFLFFVPLRFCRLLACYSQVFLMLAISLTGNYNFFNLLTTALCLSLVDDEHLEFLSNFFFCCSRKESNIRSATSKKSCLTIVSNIAVLAFLGYASYQLTSYGNKFNLAFTQEHLDTFLNQSMPAIIWIGAVLLACKIAFVTVSTFKSSGIASLLRVVIVVIPSVYLFTISLVPFSSLLPGYQHQFWPIVHQWHSTTGKFELVHSYGLFRRMTGVGGRPELVIEGSNTLDGPWKEYEFVYKPGKLSHSPRWTVPHQPRLDWQMWFAALGSYQYNQWYIGLVHRLLIGQPEVLDLLDRDRLLFKKAPKYIRSKLYHYHFTKLKKDGTVPKSWWKRKFQKEYSPPLTLEDTSMLEFLKYHKLMPVKPRKTSDSFVENSLDGLRPIVKQLHPPYLLWGLLFSALGLSALYSLLFTGRGGANEKEKME